MAKYSALAALIILAALCTDAWAEASPQLAWPGMIVEIDVTAMVAK